MWYRVFGTEEEPPAPEALQARLHEIGAAVVGHFRGDDAGWFRAEIVFADTAPIHVERFLAGEEGIRAELNSWAAYLETCAYSPNFAPLMEQMIHTKQLFTIRKPLDSTDEMLARRICLDLAQFFAQVTNGVYQVDRQGFFTAHGTLLLQEFDS